MLLQRSKGFEVIDSWLASKALQPFAFQEEAWQRIINGDSGVINAPTGCGKTFSVFLGALIQFINQHPNNWQQQSKNGLQLLWITPLRALAKDIGRAMEEALFELNMQWKVAIRNGDTEISERQKQKRQMPEVLIITPESLHLLLAQKGYPDIFKTLRLIAVDEWHELIGSKRGVLVELALSRIIGCKRSASLSIWGISATIGNLEQAAEVLLAPLLLQQSVKTESVIIKAELSKQLEIISVLPDEIEKYPWAGHLGLTLAHKVVPIIEQSNTTLVFINTRGMSERWYQTLLDIAPQFAGAIALHHGSVEHELRIWVEEALHTKKLKAVVCTASLDLGVDFRPVDTVIQVGSPKGVARFLQRAGRSGHRPGDTSKIYFLPTHSLELVEAAALKEAVKIGLIESREPMILCFDVLIQYLCSIAISEGFTPKEIFKEIKATYCFADITEDEWRKVLDHITTGGNALQQYDEYKKVEVEDGVYRIKSRRIAMRHRMHIGTIVSDPMLKVKFLSGGYIGVIEESFISRLEPGNVFTLAGRNLELISIKEMTVVVKKSNSKKSIVPSWNGGRMPLSANLSWMLRETFNHALTPKENEIELSVLHPLFELQQRLSHVPGSGELLIEHIETKDGFHLFVYPFEGRLVHEAMAALLAYRISKITPITFSMAMNDYGFELLSDQPIPVDDLNAKELFTTDDLLNDIQRSVNAIEMAKRKFRDIAVIGGLIFQGYPGEHKKARHLQSSASLLFKVFAEYDPDNILIQQAYREVFAQQMEEVRLRNALQRIQDGRIIVLFPERLTPFCFPIKVDSLSRENLTSEKLEDRVKRMQRQLER
ncbi:MAG: ligase-associated DNA damage response DEXH box helicase [Ilyomonas sp.]